MKCELRCPVKHMLLGGISHDHMKPMSDAMEDSTDWITSILTFVTNLVAPEPEEHEGISISHDLHTTTALLAQNLL